MAQRVQVVFEDDIDGSVADETVRFAIDNVEYEIDLSEKNAGKLRDAFATYIIHGRKIAGRRRTSKPQQRGTASDIRAWAASNGYQVRDRGRVSSEIREAYERAHK